MAGHEGHRERLRKRLQRTGLDNFEPHEALELLLTYVIPRRDTNPVAHALINRFGSVYRVLNASPQELVKVEGVGESAALFLNLLPQLFRYYNISANEEVTRFGVITDSRSAYNYIAPYFIGRKVEMLYLIGLTSSGCPIRAYPVAEGEVNYATVDNRRLIEAALQCNASAVIICHNHPDGTAEPSEEDILMTERISKVFEAIDIILIDHLIIAGDDFVSFVDSKLIEYG